MIDTYVEDKVIELTGSITLNNAGAVSSTNAQGISDWTGPDGVRYLDSSDSSYFAEADFLGGYVRIETLNHRSYQGDQHVWETLISARGIVSWSPAIKNWIQGADVEVSTPVITSPTNNQQGFDSENNSITWAKVTNADKYWLSVGSYSGGKNFYDSGEITDLSKLVTGLIAGSTMFATVWAHISGSWVQATTVSFTVIGGGVIIDLPPINNPADVLLSKIKPIAINYMKADFNGAVDPTPQRPDPDTPWEYAPSYNMRKLYNFTGDSYYNTQANFIFNIYSQHIDAQGFFDLKNLDFNYPYKQALYSYPYMCASNTDALAIKLYNACKINYNYILEPANATTMLITFTERNLGFYLKAAVFMRDDAKVLEILTKARQMQLHPMNDVSGLAPNGLLNHYVEGGADVSVSPWMSCIFLGGVKQAYDAYPAYRNLCKSIATDMLNGIIDLCTYKTSFNTGENGFVIAYIVNPYYALNANRFPGLDETSDYQHPEVTWPCLEWAEVLKTTDTVNSAKFLEWANKFFYTFNILIKTIEYIGPIRGLYPKRVFNWLFWDCPYELLNNLTVNISPIWPELFPPHAVRALQAIPLQQSVLLYDLVTIQGDPPVNITVNFKVTYNFEVWTKEDGEILPIDAISNNVAFYYKPKNIYQQPLYNLIGGETRPANVKVDLTGDVVYSYFGKTNNIADVDNTFYGVPNNNDMLSVGLSEGQSLSVRPDNFKASQIAAGQANYIQGKLFWKGDADSFHKSDIDFGPQPNSFIWTRDPINMQDERAVQGIAESAINISSNIKNPKLNTYRIGYDDTHSDPLSGKITKINLTSSGELSPYMPNLRIVESSPNYYPVPHIMYYGEAEPALSIRRRDVTDIENFKDKTYTALNVTQSVVSDSRRWVTGNSEGTVQRAIINDLVRLFNNETLSQSVAYRSYLAKKIDASSDIFNWSNYLEFVIRAKANITTTITMEIIYSDVYRDGFNGLSFSEKTAVYNIPITTDFTNIKISIPKGLIRNTENIVGHCGLKSITNIKYIIPPNITLDMDKIYLQATSKVTVDTAHTLVNNSTYPKFNDDSTISFTDTWKSICFLNSFDQVDMLTFTEHNSLWGMPSIYGTHSFSVSTFVDLLNLQEGIIAEVINGDWPVCWLKQVTKQELPSNLFATKMAHAIKVPPFYFKYFEYNLNLGIEVNAYITGAAGQLVELKDRSTNKLLDQNKTDIHNAGFTHDINVLTGISDPRYITVDNKNYPRDWISPPTLGSFITPTGTTSFLSLIGKNVGDIIGVGGIINVNLLGKTKIVVPTADGHVIFTEASLIDASNPVKIGNYFIVDSVWFDDSHVENDFPIYFVLSRDGRIYLHRGIINSENIFVPASLIEGFLEGKVMDFPGSYGFCLADIERNQLGILYCLDTDLHLKFVNTLNFTEIRDILVHTNVTRQIYTFAWLHDDNRSIVIPFGDGTTTKLLRSIDNGLTWGFV